MKKRIEIYEDGYKIYEFWHDEYYSFFSHLEDELFIIQELYYRTTDKRQYIEDMRNGKAIFRYGFFGDAIEVTWNYDIGKVWLRALED